MLYGILLESVRDGILKTYGNYLWKKLVEQVPLEHDTFTIFDRYDENLIERIAIHLSYLNGEGTSDDYMEFFGKCFVRFFTTYGYDKILRVAGRHFRDFLRSIDQLHDSTKYSYPQMKSPLFHLLQEDQSGAFLQYKSHRRGFQRYIIGQLKECALRFYDQDIYVHLHDDISTSQYTMIIFRVDFNNSILKETSLIRSKLVHFMNIRSETFFRIFPFCILIDSSMKIQFLGKSIQNLFSNNINLIGNSFEQTFKLIRPDIPLLWNNLISYGRHIVFIMESRFNVSSGNENNLIRLKGEMKWLHNSNLIAFLCHPILSTTEEMMNLGLSIDDLNFYDGSSEILLSGMQHATQLQAAIDKQHAWISKLQSAKIELEEWKKKGKRLLYSMMPHHIAKMLEQGVVPNSICESHKLITVLFCYSLDLNDLIKIVSPYEMVQSINNMIILFDQSIEKYNVFKVETKADSSYMILSGIDETTKKRFLSSGSYTSIQNSIICDENNQYHFENIKNPLQLNQVEIISAVALDLLDQSKKLINQITNKPFQIKMGFHSGPAVAGIVGHKNYQYCLFGDTINTASRLTTTSEVGKIQLSCESWLLLKNSIYFQTIPRGSIHLKGKGDMNTYWLMAPTNNYIQHIQNIQ